MGRDARGARAPGYWPLVGLSFSTPHSEVPGVVVKPIGGPTFELLGLNGPWERFSSVSLLTYGGSWPIKWDGPSSNTSFEGAARGGVRMIFGEAK